MDEIERNQKPQPGFQTLAENSRGDRGSMISNRRKPLTVEEQKETCPACGHTRGAHHNPDDRCISCDCGYYFYGEKDKS